MGGKMDAKVRMVKCPRCRGVLPEPPGVPVYQCGGCGAKLQAKKRNNNGTVDTTSQRSVEDYSGKQKVDRVFVDQEAGSSSNQQSLLNSADGSDRNSDHKDDLHNSSNKDQDSAKRAENGTVGAPQSAVEEYSSENLKMKQLSDNQEPCCSSNQQSLCNSTNESDKKGDHNDLHGSSKDQDAVAKKAENGRLDAPTSVVEERSSEILKIKKLSDDQEPCCSSNQQSLCNSTDELDQNSDHIDLHGLNKDQDAAAKRAENGTLHAPPSAVEECSSEIVKIKELSDNQEPYSSNQQLVVNSSDEPDHYIHNDPRNSTEFSAQEDPGSSPEATAHNRTDQEQDQCQYQDAGKQQENVTVVELKHFSGEHKSKQLSDDNETGSSSELSYHHDPESSPEATVDNSVKQHETEFVSCRKGTEIEDGSSEMEEAIANTRIDSDGGSKSSFRSMIAEKLLDTRQKKAVYLDEDDLLSEEDGSANLRHRRRLGRISSVESMETTRFGGMSYYGYEGSVSSFDGNDDHIPRKYHIGSIRDDEHVGSGNGYRLGSMDVRSFHGLDENPRHRPSMIPENPKMERIELLKLVRELQDQLERTNISNYNHVLNNPGRYGPRMAFSGEATMVNSRRDGDLCHHCCPQDRHFSAQLPRHHVCCNGPNYGPKRYCSRRFSGPSSPKQIHSESDFSAPDDHWQRNDVRRPFRSPKKKQYVRPIAGGSPWIACYRCFKLLQLPQSFLLFNKRYHSLRCGACLKVLNFKLSDRTRVCRYYPEETIAAPPSSEAEDYDNLAGPVSCSDRSFEKSYSTETDRNGSRESGEERRKATMSRDPSSSTRPPSSRISGRRTTTPEIEEEVEPVPSGSPLHWLMGYASPSKVIRGL